MSTYLVALLVSDFHCAEGFANAGSSKNLPLRICARPNIPIEHLEYSLDVGIGAIEFYEKLFEIEYPLPKSGLFVLIICSTSCLFITLIIDNIALPDFQLGGMENWGMICYRLE